MNIAHQVTYIATDPEREVIPWVQSKSPDGKITTYRSTEVEISEQQLKEKERRIMDCIDCHNHPTHIYHHPAQSVNSAMFAGWISPTLHSVKNIAVKALEYPYSTNQHALDSIHSVMSEFYRTNYPDIASSQKDKIETQYNGCKQFTAEIIFRKCR
jgi:hypothetical protein